MLKTTTVVGTVAIVATAAYLCYFDFKRRSDKSFRKAVKVSKSKAQAEHQRITKERVLEAKSRASSSVPGQFLAQLENDPLPITQQDKEAYFIRHLDAGEKLLAQGPSFHEAAANCFYRVLNIYPDPMQLLAVLETTIPAPVFSIVMAKMVSEVKQKQSDYRNYYPPQDMNVKIIDVAHGTSPEGKQLTRRGLSMTREIKMGELVYKESPLVAALYPDVTGYCSNCLKKSTNVDGTFCSSECKDMAALSYGSKFVIPLSNDQTDFSAQKLVSICNEFNSITPLLTSKFLFRMIYEESLVEKQQYSIWDHIDRLHYIDLSKPSPVGDEKIWFATLEEIEKESKVLDLVFSTIPKFDKFLTLERYTVLKGKFLYNAIEILPKVSLESTTAVNSVKPEYFKKSSSDKGIGSGLYHISSYMSHSCAPNVEAVFEGSELKLVAKRDLKIGEEIFLSFVDVGLDLKDRRRILKEKYRFMCKCEACGTN